MWKIGKNAKIGELWRPILPKPYCYVVQKSWQTWEIAGLWTTIWIEQYLSATCLLSCRLVWVMCMFDPLQFWGFWGQVTPKWKVFENSFRYISTVHGFTFCGQICWNSAIVKLPKSLVLMTKKLRLRGSRPTSPFCPTGPIRPKFLPLDLYQYVGSVTVCRSYSRKTDLSDPEVITISAESLLFRLSASNYAT